MNKNQKRDNAVNKIRSIAIAQDCKIAHNGYIGNDQFTVEIIKDYTKRIASFYFAWNKNTFTFDCVSNKINTQITKDNIHLYYEFMSSVSKSDYRDILHNIFSERLKKISLAFGDIIDNNIILETSTDALESNTKVISQKVMGIKDTLKPLDEYIAEIKESEAYKEYIYKTIEDCDFCEYIAEDKNGKKIYVTNNMSGLDQFAKALGVEIEYMAFQDSVNTCPCCGKLYYIEDLIQLENDIICIDCHED